ncbi:hypothetical protein L228DRAFT_283185 [Xylona heveae TC161]|uniref:N-acetyltransferase domain-containing protein n=1 Tax=Xylona heveae (strain CBS 132557 / TC161) TaxID=1328760 RepID=A0A165GBC3_XYLHT|nr:hypothetical protein L228DRAFT_283185 [Xylona heveae TC161]KZF21984.1 hypothetical protein L228DRAFT_283185 [Xylona heveae TC161]
MSFAIQPCSPADAPGLAATMMGARLTDPHWVFLWKDPCPQDIIARASERLPWNLISGRDTKRHQKVINVETGKVVGYARWSLPPDLAKAGNVWLEAQVAEPSRVDLEIYEKNFKANTDNGRLIGLKTGAMIGFRSAPLEAADARIMRDGPFLMMDYLTTDPAFWRRGIASMLVQSGLKVADRYGIKTYAMSEPAGLKVYLNHGFKLVETVSTDYSKYGGTEPLVEYFLVREPVSLQPR